MLSALLDAIAAVLNASFGPMLGLVTWVALPLYAVALGLYLAHYRPQTTDESGRLEGSGASRLLATQITLLGASLALTALHRGAEGGFAQGQLTLGAGALRLQTVVLALGGLGLAFLAPVMSYRALTGPALGLRPGSLAPLVLALWALLPLVTHLSSALLILELVGVALIWGVTGSPSRGGSLDPAGAPLGVANGVILFIWASGLSALALLLTLGLSGLGAGLSGGTPLGLGGPKGLLGGGFVAAVISLKFLVGGGQFLLMA